ncbi:hypothetical protein EV284_6498 [Streptomyces sp. BK022]|uniref:phage tail tube protein n=1 Tax=Streptomyces sp. BK022 TaxID=2512123 RepID=UPI00102A2B59|nr:hypothetical protein [Streptomyces sp. BK022]RZU28332.1 hypothetical protein EV284_6498 [Streptomyces sp. BK022]
MATNVTNTEMVVPTITRVYLGPVGTTAPADATSALDPALRDVGFTSEDSLKFNEEVNFEQVKSAQSLFPTRTFQTSDAATVEVDLQQWSAPNFKAVYGGGTITEISVAGPPAVKHYKFAPPKIGGRGEVMAVVEVIDGGKHYRYVLPRCMQMEGVSKDLAQAKAAVLPLRLAVQGGDNLDAWYMLTDDPAFALTA